MGSVGTLRQGMLTQACIEPHSCSCSYSRYDSIGAVVKMEQADFHEWHTVSMNVVIDEHCEMYQWPNVPLNDSFAQRCREGSRVEYWFDGMISTRLNGIGLGAKGVTNQREVPQEPLYILLELKISPSAGFGTPPEDALPVTFQLTIDPADDTPVLVLTLALALALFSGHVPN